MAPARGSFPPGTSAASLPRVPAGRGAERRAASSREPGCSSATHLGVLAPRGDKQRPWQTLPNLVIYMYLPAHIYIYICVRVYIYMHKQYIQQSYPARAYARSKRSPPPQKIKLKSECKKKDGNAGAPAKESVRREGPPVSGSAERSPASSPGVTSPCQSKRHNRGNRVMGSEEPRNSPASPTRQLRDVARRLLQAVQKQRGENG